MKENGFNAVRIAHNPASQITLETCDKLGMYVLNETFDGWYIPKTYHDYARWFSEDWKQDVTAMVESARNHPSVILYSHGNEVSETATERGTEVCRELTDFIHCMSGEKGAGGYGGPISVAVCDTPDGHYEYYGFVRNPDGSPMLKYVTFDPAVINDAGVIRLYYGTWYPFHEYGKLLEPIFRKVESKLFGKTVAEIRACPDGIMGANHVILADDMLTIVSEPCHILPSWVKGTSFEKHPFFEGSSIRKIGSTYYFIYSSSKGHELCYATSPYPDRAFVYGGTIVSNGDVGYQGRRERDRLNATGTNHGSIERINGQWYVFYHRNTHKSAYSRQACAESIEIRSDGSIPQVEMTSQGIGRSLEADRTYPASICCNLYSGLMPHIGNGVIKKSIPFIADEDGRQIVVATNKTRIVYKYFDLADGEYILTMRCKSGGSGKLSVQTGLDEAIALTKPSKTWDTMGIPCSFRTGIQPLILHYHGSKEFRIQSLCLRRRKRYENGNK